MRSGFFFKKGRVPSDALEGECDIDIKPMMNVLVILIPFLVSVAEYTHLSILELNLPANVTAAALPGVAAEKPKPKLTVVITPTHFAIILGESMLDSIARVNDNYDYTALEQKLVARHGSLGGENDCLVAVSDPVAFKFVVRVMDICRAVGFSKVGLAAATIDPTSGK
ncbi:MAG: biopolymer transporter ExbD [Chitinivibrionales bacterium]|nr:biopolymer transporter ExbD [Chitinivibrionales bacterium]